VCIGESIECYQSFYIYAITNLDEVKDGLLEEIERALEVKLYPPEELRTLVVNEIRAPRAIVRGGYDPAVNQILLSGKLWCRKTLIHELLHAVSYFTREPRLFEVLNHEREFIEGLTEFLTGYVLYQRYKNCYSAWISKKYLVCLIASPEKYVRLFGALARVLIPLREFIKLYVYNPGTDWFNEYESFLSRYGLEDFLINKPKKKRKIPTIILLEDMIVNVLRNRMSEKEVEEFRELLHEAPLDVVLDYGSMIK